MKLHTTIIVANDSMKKELSEFISSFDSDFSGENGDNYIDSEAVDNGYKSSTEYFYDKAVNEGKTPKEILSSVLFELEGTYQSGEYVGAESSVVEVDENKFVICFAYASRN